MWGRRFLNVRYRAIILLLSGSLLRAQMNTAEISGPVRDPLGDIVPGATPVAEHLETGRKSTTVSNNAGESLFAQLPVGFYSLTASAPNLKDSPPRRIEIHAADRLRIK